ncbi:MAG: putative ABC exporter domain-containing protein, partial [Acutalibacteraceae bacterium]
MNALLFLTVKKAKNRIKEMLHRPSELVIVIIFIALIVMNIFTAGHGGMEYARRDINEFYAIVFAVYALVFLLSAKTGFVNG